MAAVRSSRLSHSSDNGTVKQLCGSARIACRQFQRDNQTAFQLEYCYSCAPVFGASRFVCRAVGLEFCAQMIVFSAGGYPHRSDLL